MVNLKTKSEKHVNDNEKRRQSLKEREKAKLNQSLIIRQALSNATLQNNSSTKITFSDEDDESKGTDVRNNLNKSKISSLFDNSEYSENEDFEFKEKIQFSGKKGFELLNLQSTYGNDERFKIDKRFYENETNNSDEEENKISDIEIKNSEEKTKNLKILENVLGTPFKPEKENKSKKRVYEMVRYDVSNKDHERFEINTQSSTIKSSLKKKKEGKKITNTYSENIYKPKVLKEKFYEVSSEIKDKLKKKENGQFSILETYGVNNVAIDQESYLNGTEHKEDSGSDLSEFIDERNCKINTDYKELKRENKKVDQQQVNGFKAQGIWKEPFFFDQEDLRFKDALEFINKKNSEEATEAAENYEKTRKRLKEILRLHFKKHMHRRDPFKKKIGGMNKKQLAKTRLKNQKTTFSKRNMPKKSPA